MNVAKLRGAIVAKGMTQKDVAQALGISEKTFYLKMKRGAFGTDEAEKMVKLLGIDNPVEIFLRSE